ncbi:MAG: hypothetical protein M3081_05560 [Gemmatimonadota bacterium]|nr:hypothetical protein [Gemmatimonadota bacterium]
MTRSKGLAISFLLGALLVGGALGFTADRLVHKEHSRREMRDRLATDLGLTAPQRMQFDTILERRNHDFETVMAPLKPRLDSIREKARQDIRQLLTADQQRKFEEILNHQKQSQKERK